MTSGWKQGFQDENGLGGRTGPTRDDNITGTISADMMETLKFILPCLSSLSKSQVPFSSPHFLANTSRPTAGQYSSSARGNHHYPNVSGSTARRSNTTIAGSRPKIVYLRNTILSFLQVLQSKREIDQNGTM